MKKTLFAVLTSMLMINAHSQTWNLSGNSISSGNFLGTTNNQDLIFKRNNADCGYVSTTNTNFGLSALPIPIYTGLYNSAFGTYALNGNLYGNYNTGIGAFVLTGNYTGNNNVAVGYSSMNLNDNGSENTAIGNYALEGINSGNRNVAIGHLASNNANGYNNVAVGYSSLFNNSGYSNVAMGTHSLYNSIYGHNLVAIGDSALYHQTTNSNNFYFNTAVGSKALYTNTIGYSNTGIGLNALFYNENGFENTAIGKLAMMSNTSGSSNTVIGTDALLVNLTGSYNTAIGQSTLITNVDGSYNVALGFGATNTNQSLNNNTLLGTYTYNNGDNSTAIGAYASVSPSDWVYIGDFNVKGVETALAYYTTSDGRFKNNIKENVKGLEFIKLLRPVVYNFDIKKLEEHSIQNFPDSMKQKRLTTARLDKFKKSSAIVQTGFIAQEVEAAANKIGYDFNGIHKPQNPTDHYSLSYEKFVVPLVKSVQELSTENDKKDKTITELKTQVDKLQKQMEEILLQLKKSNGNLIASATSTESKVIN